MGNTACKHGDKDQMVTKMLYYEKQAVFEREKISLRLRSLDRSEEVTVRVHPFTAVLPSLRREMCAEFETVAYGGEELDDLDVKWAVLGVEEGAVLSARWTYVKPLTDDTIHEAVEQWCHPATRGEVRMRHRHISKWDVSPVTSMNGLFKDQSKFNDDISGWDVSHVQDTSYMFDGATAFDRPLNAWNMSSVTDTSCMFQKAEAFNQSLNSWDMSSVTDTRSMFYGAKAFNQPLDSWDMSSVTSTAGMFGEAKTFNQPLDSWDMSQVTDDQYMFYHANAMKGKNKPRTLCRTCQDPHYI